MSTLKRSKFYVQRDLEDQILEEKLQSKNLDSNSLFNNLETNHLKTKSMADTQVAAAKREIKVSEVLALLKAGYTRLQKHDKGSGSVQAHYGLTASQVKELFEAPKLKGKKTQLSTIVAIDDAPNEPISTMKPKTAKAAKASAPAAKVAASDSQLFS